MPISSQDAGQIVAGTHADPFSVLGLHKVDGKQNVADLGTKYMDATTMNRLMQLLQLATPTDPVQGAKEATAFQ